jgi:GT2 family glycosyltransferase
VSEQPDLSVVVALISGKVDDLRTCLAALRGQADPIDREILVPFDQAAANVAELAKEFPEVEFIPAEESRPVAERRGMVREHHDTLRTVGIEKARGRVVALTEDHAHVSPDWARSMLAALERFPKAGAVGGAVDCDSRSLLNWAVYFGDFGRYQSPVPEGSAEFVSDANVAYRREALERAGDGWKVDFHETMVHWAMARDGWDLAMTPEGLVWQRRGRLSFATALRERFVWGKSFAGSRCHDLTLPRRAIFAVLSPVIPFLFTWRGWKMASSRGRAGRFVAALPLFFLLQCFWALGECAGYATGKP